MGLSVIRKWLICLFGCRNELPQKIIIVFPGFGILPKEYDYILPKNIHKVYLDIWTDDELTKILRNIEINKLGPPGTPSYEEWFDSIVSNCNEKILSEMKKYGYKLPIIIYFSHSIGSEIAKNLLNYADGIISYGGIVKKSHIKTKNLLGTEDKIASKYYESWPKDAYPMIDMNHFSCVSEEGKNRSLTWRKRIGIPNITETEHKKDQRYIIKREIEWFTGGFYKARI